MVALLGRHDDTRRLDGERLTPRCVVDLERVVVDLELLVKLGEFTARRGSRILEPRGRAR